MSNLELDDITLWGMNIPKEVENTLKQIDIDDSFPNEECVKAYHLGIENALLILKQLLNAGLNGESLTFYYPKAGATAEEMSIDSILEWISSMK